jgi:hypothetical protein
VGSYLSGHDGWHRGRRDRTQARSDAEPLSVMTNRFASDPELERRLGSIIAAASRQQCPPCGSTRRGLARMAAMRFDTLLGYQQ